MSEVEDAITREGGGLLDLREAARVVGVGYEGFRRWAVARPPEGFPPFVMIGNRYYFRRLQLMRWLEGDVFTLEGNRREARAESSQRRGRGRPPNQPRA